MKEIVHVILEDEERDLLLYLRDSAVKKPHIPFPDHWDLIGGHVDAEDKENPDEDYRIVALIRETREEIAYDLSKEELEFVGRYECSAKDDAYPNVKYIYRAKLRKPISEINLVEDGQELRGFKPSQIPDLKIANILKRVLMDYIKAYYP